MLLITADQIGWEYLAYQQKEKMITLFTSIIYKQPGAPSCSSDFHPPRKSSVGQEETWNGAQAYPVSRTPAGTEGRLKGGQHL